jgi:hypothetical protein
MRSFFFFVLCTLYCHFSALSIIDYPFGTDPGSFKLTDISYRLRFSFVSFACIVLSCNWFVRFVYRSFHIVRVKRSFVFRSFNEIKS